MKYKILIFALLVAWMMAGRPAYAAKSYHAEHYDVNLSVQADGSMVVTETIVFRFDGGPFTYVFRDLSTNETDGIRSIQASMDGVVLPEGKSAGYVEIQGGNPINVTWHFSPVSDSTNTFTLSYRVFGAIRQDGYDTLIWRAVPEKHDYETANSEITLQYPPETSLVGEPQLEGAPAQVETGQNQVVFNTQSIPKDTALVVKAQFQPGSLVQSAPGWQARQREQASQVRRALPWGVVALLLVFTAGIGLLVLFALRNRRENFMPPDRFSRPSSPPGPVAPALAAWLTGNKMPAQATIFDLARRGVLNVEETQGHWKSQKFTITLQPVDFVLKPHEQGLLEVLFESRKGATDRLEMSDVANRLAGGPKKYSQPLEEELVAAGWLDLQREKQHNRLGITGLVVLFLGIAGFLAGVVLGGGASGAGNWGFLPFSAILIGADAALFVIGVVALVLSATFSPLSNDGETQAAAWKGFAAYLKDVTRGREPTLRPDAFDLYLPYAAGFGLASPWVKYFERQGNTPVPAWFKSLQASTSQDDFGAVAVFIAASGSSFSGGADGGGAAGASGGGASGAG
jgi:hypothetical protein